mmetsp:Transcript_2216/g.8130  ORF Transcript_2216/g.8130 Transcript_2216/m.8130 type:complete len:948 (-) Transcript_2216:1791-4634(-)|eukprot:CAMPEP_0117441728 /NCGR_PEP_ID=MMETSP0759-20121206/3782_1 /TAXON_ID=63605 /ORGANISM="Percolomonas cosmopolitus, Strain WS" /LENGTH=947 /DNA_ID=CAMNT_0005233587 /DNA_START=100 /DNA_END=2943 /DNA_ORIENTATION=+
MVQQHPKYASPPLSPLIKTTLSPAIFERQDSNVSSEVSYQSGRDDQFDTDSQKTPFSSSRSNLHGASSSSLSAIRKDLGVGSSPPLYGSGPSGEQYRRSSMISMVNNRGAAAGQVGETPLHNKPTDHLAIPLKGRRRRVIRALCFPCISAHRFFSFVEQKTPLFVKLACLTVPALLCLTLMALGMASQSIVSLSSSTKVHSLNRVSLFLSALQAAVQDERTVFIGLTQSNFTYFVDETANRLQTTATAMESWENEKAQLSSDRYKESVQSLNALLEQLPQQRALYLSRTLSVFETLISLASYYEKLDTVLTTLMNQIQSDIASDYGATGQALSLTEQKNLILNVKKVWNSKTSIMVLTLLYGTWNVNATAQVNADSLLTWTMYQQENIRENDTLLKLSIFLPDDEWANFRDGYNLLVAPLRSVEQSTLSTVAVLPQAHNPETFFADATKVITFLTTSEVKKVDQVEAASDSNITSNIIFTVIVLFILVFVVVPLIALTLVFCRIIYKPVMIQRRNLKTAIQIAEALVSLKFDSPGVQALEHKDDETCSQLEIAFKQILENFQSYLPYIPRHLLARDDEEEEAQAKLGDGEDTASDMSFELSQKDTSFTGSFSQKDSFHRTLHRSQSRSTGISKTSSGGSGSRRRSNLSASLRHRSRGFSSLSRKPMTIMVVDLNDFCKMCLETDYDSLQRLYAEYVNTLAAIMKQSNGLMHSFSGGIFVCSWGAIGQRHFEMAKKASNAALQVVQFTRSNPSLSVRVRIGISSGSCLVGEMGGEDVRALQVIGAPMSIAFGLTKLCKKYACSIMCDYATYKNVNFDFDLKQQDVLVFADMSTTASMNGAVFQLVANKGVVESEWMYSMQDSERKDIFSTFNKAWKHAQSGEYNEASSLLEEFKSKMALHQQKEGGAQSAAALQHNVLEDIVDRGLKDRSFRYRAFCRNWKIESNVEV